MLKLKKGRNLPIGFTRDKRVKDHFMRLTSEQQRQLLSEIRFMPISRDDTEFLDRAAEEFAARMVEQEILLDKALRRVERLDAELATA